MAARSDEAQPLLDALETRGILTFLAGAVLGLTARTLLAALTGGPSPAAKKRSASATVARRPKPQLPAPREELKMVLCVNQSLGMGKGKIGAQCAHAAVGVLQKHFNSATEVAFRQWERFGQPKITLKIPDETAMVELAARAAAAGLPWYIVHDAGRTQVAAGSQTVLAIGPGYRSVIDAITGKLPLL